MTPEKHLGKITAVSADYENAGAVKVQVNTIAEGQDLDEDWVPPSLPFAGDEEGLYFVPKIGTLVEVEVEANQEKGTEDLNARWTAAHYSNQQKLPTEFRSNPANRMGAKVGLSTLLFDRLTGILALISGNLRLGEEGATHPLVRGDTINDQLATWLTAVEAFLDATGTLSSANAEQFGLLNTAAVGPLAPLKVPFGVIQAAWSAFAGAVTTFKSATTVLKNVRTSWLSTKVKTE